MRNTNGEFDVASEAASSSSNSNGEPSPPTAGPGSAAAVMKEEQAQSTTGGVDMSSAPSPSAVVTSSSVAGGGREKTLCLVCAVVSDNHHIHYGALACFRDGWMPLRVVLNFTAETEKAHQLQYLHTDDFINLIHVRIWNMLQPYNEIKSDDNAE